MTGLSLLQGALRSALASQGTQSEQGESYWLDNDRGLDEVRRGGGAAGGRRQAERRYGAGRGSPPGGGGSSGPAFPTSSSRVSGLARGGQSAVIKVVGFAAGGQRVGALAAYVTHEREGGVITEDESAVTLDRAAVTEKLGRWKQSYSERKPTKDVAAIRFDLRADPAQETATIEIAVTGSLAGHHHALRTVAKGAGLFEVAAVVVAEGRSWSDRVRDRSGGRGNRDRNKPWPRRLGLSPRPAHDRRCCPRRRWARDRDRGAYPSACQRLE